MSIAQLDRLRACRAAVGSRFGQLLDVAYDIEFGAECTDQSALNLLYLLGYIGQGRLRLVRAVATRSTTCAAATTGSSSALAAALAGQIRTSSGADGDPSAGSAYVS